MTIRAQLLEETQRICDEQGIIIDSEDNLYYYMNILFGVDDPRLQEPEPFNEEEADLRQQFKNLNLD